MVDATREARLRRKAKSMDLKLVKSRRDGTFGLIDPYSNTWAAYAPDWQNGYGLSLDAIEHELTEDRATS